MRAIILAAGMGTRLRPLTNDKPKALVSVMGEPMIERQIAYLKQIGITEIIVVTGYLGHKFDYLEQKHGAKVIHNDKYDTYNNGYTMYLVREYLDNAYVLEGDVYLANNFLDPDIKQSTYFSGMRSGFREEWMLVFDTDDRVININVGDGEGYIMSGVSYWSHADGLKIRELLEKTVEKPGFEKLFWDDMVKDNLREFDISIRKIGSEDWFEIDSVADLEKAEELLRSGVR